MKNIFITLLLYILFLILLCTMWDGILLVWLIEQGLLIPEFIDDFVSEKDLSSSNRFFRAASIENPDSGCDDNNSADKEDSAPKKKKPVTWLKNTGIKSSPPHTGLYTKLLAVKEQWESDQREKKFLIAAAIVTAAAIAIAELIKLL